MPSIPSVKKVMTPFPFTIDMQQSIRTANLMMEDHGVRHLPVVGDGKLVGIVSDRDLRVARNVWGPDRSIEVGTPVGAVCTLEPHTVELDAPLDDVILEMADRHIGSAVVMKGEKIAGILTTTDACRLLGQLLRELAVEGPQSA